MNLKPNSKPASTYSLESKILVIKLKKTKNLLILLGIFLFLFIVFFVVNPKVLLKTIQGTNLWYFLPVFLLCFPLVGFKAWRWQLLMKKQNIYYSLWSCFKMYSVGIFLSLVTPGKIGEAAKIFYLHQDKYSIRQSLITIILDRILDLAFLFIFAFIGFIIFIHYFAQEVIYLSLAGIGITILFYIFIKAKLYYRLIGSLVPEKYQDTFIKHSRDFFADLKKYNFSSYLIGFILTILAWLIYILQIYFLSLALGLNLKFLFLIPMIAVANITSLLPISFNGLGTREAVFIFFFSLIGLSVEQATALGILQFSIGLFTAILGFSFWLKKPIRLKAND